MTTAKPICVIRIRDIDPERTFDITESLEKSKPDYHWFVINSMKVDELEFEVFYEKDLKEVNYQELKDIISKYAKEQSEANAD